VVPVRIGGGTRLKVVEAFAVGKPVVSTSLGAEGIQARHGEHLLIGDTADAFASQVVRLLADPDQGARLGAAAATLARGQYSWVDAATKIDEIYRSVVSDRRTVAS
jgi:glycosyltransferase involved in cell wall biosynthesis